MTARAIVHMDLDSFFVSVERLLNSDLNGKPVIIAGSSDRGVVSSCSYEARQFGVHSAMPSKMARQLCPQGIFISGHYEQYSYYSRIVTQLIVKEAPVVEKASIDEHYLDISGMDRYIKHSMLWAHELREKIIRETGLPISYGLSTNKTISKMATNEAKPNGEKQVEPGSELSFLAPLSIKKIPGVGEKTYMLLRNMGIERIGTIQQMPIESIQRTLGETGAWIWRKANGIDHSPVEPYSERKSISSERTFEKDTCDLPVLKQYLVKMVFELCYQLRREGKVSGCVAIKLRYSNFETKTFQIKIPFTASDHLIMEKVMELFNRNYSQPVMIRLIGVKLSQLSSGFSQIDLFDDSEEKMKLYQALDKIRNRYGDQSIMRGVGLKKKL